MRRGGRALGWNLFLVTHIFYSWFTIAVVSGIDYGVPVEIKLWDTGRSPLAHMVDVTNGFGLKVLAEHNFLNDNNIAFSPYGLMGIMVALYEGVDGESSYQIQRGMQLPWNRNVMRIGFRDIHRTLKTYFVPEEGFLAGLALNNENVTFNDNYKKILRFYGFDLENDQLPTLTTSNSTSNETTTGTTSPASNSEITTSPTMTESQSQPESTTSVMREDTTLNPNAETIDVRAPIETTTTITTISSNAPNTESTTETSVATDAATTVENEPQSTTEIATTISTTITSMTSPSTNAPITAELTATTEDSVSADADAETIAQQTSQASSALTEPTTNNEATTTVDMGISTIETTSIVTSTTTTDEVTEAAMSKSNTQTDGTTTSADMTTLSEASTTNNSPLETLQRRKKSIVDFIFTNPPYIDDHFFFKSNHVGPELPVPAFDDKMFLANGLKSVQVTFMHYDTVLEHAYLPHLEASALRLPLDSERYYLLVVLPNRGGVAELGRLLGRMARESDLADVYAALRPRRVRAVVPSFIVKGHVTLTTDLQKLGIRDVFEPRQRDFTPMTGQAGVYVRSIEQAVSVAIRKYRPDEHKKNRYVLNRDPVRFSATYPFLYFVMDATIHVALMAGKMVDPLNSRIL